MKTMDRKSASEEYKGPVSIIVGPCVKDAQGWRSCGMSVQDVWHMSEWEVLRDGDAFRKPGLVVIVRPQYNDGDGPDGLPEFHEWRSFNGEDFKYTHFGR